MSDIEYNSVNGNVILRELIYFTRSFLCILPEKSSLIFKTCFVGTPTASWLCTNQDSRS